jgi:hypothetical protein
VKALALAPLVFLLSGCFVTVRPIIDVRFGGGHHWHYTGPADVPVCPPKKRGCIDDSGEHP